MPSFLLCFSPSTSSHYCSCTICVFSPTLLLFFLPSSLSWQCAWGRPSSLHHGFIGPGRKEKTCKLKIKSNKAYVPSFSPHFYSCLSRAINIEVLRLIPVLIFSFKKNLITYWPIFAFDKTHNLTFLIRMLEFQIIAFFHCMNWVPLLLNIMSLKVFWAD